MRKPSLFVLAAVAAGSLLPLGAEADTGLHAGFAARSITPVGPSPEGWNFWVGPSGVWSEEYVDTNGNKCKDLNERHVDDVRNSLIDPQSTGKFDGIWTNAGFGGRCALGAYDDTWARAAVLEIGSKKVALVSLDVVGFFYEEIERIRAELAKAHPDVDVDEVIVSSTHTHEGPDTMGLWGNPGYATDGKFPLYQAYIRSQVVEAIAEANTTRRPARMQAASVEHTLGIRDSRPPHVVDPLVQAARFVDPDGGTIGTMVNWSNHPEALGSGNPYISSDFPHGTRERLEEVYGGTAIYFSGSVGGLMTPLGVDITDIDPATGEPYGSSASSVARAYYIGKRVADAAIGALASAPLEDPAELELASREIFMTGDNASLRALNAAGIFDKPTYLEGVYAERFGDQFKTQIVTAALGSVRFQTVPGELFPEIEIGGYGRADCEEADTGRPYEPVIRDQWDEPNLFTLGLAQDELGYIVPGYDFWSFGVGNEDAPRPIVGVGVNQRRDPCNEGHYEETVSASSIMAPMVACTIADLAGKDPWSNLDAYPACSKENTTTAPQGLNLP